MENIHKGLKIGIFAGLGLLVLINIAIFSAVFIKQGQTAESEPTRVEVSEIENGSGRIQRMVLRGIDFLFGPATFP